MPYSQWGDFTLRAAQPVPVWTAAVDAKTHQHHPPITEDELRESFDALSWDTEFRGVGLDRLPTILAAGVDVEPTTAPIFVSEFDKAWEYGGWPKAVMAFDGMHLERTYREVITSDTAAGEINRLMVDYPTRVEDLAGERLWLTRFSETDTRATSAYEREFARWIPGDPFVALLAVFVFMPEGDY